MFGLCQIEPRAGRLFAMTWIVLGVLLIAVLVLDAKKRLGGDQDLWRHVPGAP